MIIGYSVLQFEASPSFVWKEFLEMLSAFLLDSAHS